MKNLVLVLFFVCLVPQALASSGEITSEVDSLLLDVEEEESLGEALKVEVRYQSPAWRIKRQGEGLKLLGMSPGVVKSLHALNREAEYRCYAEATYKPQGIQLERLRNCRSIWKNN